MDTFEASLAAYWTLMIIVSVAVVTYRTPLARWHRPRMRYWRNRSDAQRLYERSMLLGGIAVGTLSVTALYVAVVVMPRLDRSLAQIRSTTQVPYETAYRPSF